MSERPDETDSETPPPTSDPDRQDPDGPAPDTPDEDGPVSDAPDPDGPGPDAPDEDGPGPDAAAPGPQPHAATVDGPAVLTSGSATAHDVADDIPVPHATGASTDSPGQSPVEQTTGPIPDLTAQPKPAPKTRAAANTSDKTDRRRPNAKVTALIAFVACVATWPILDLTPGFDPAGHWGGLDISWVTASHVIARRGLSYGNDVVFTYGPWGFLGMPRLYYTITGVSSVIAVLSTHGLLGYYCARVLRRFAAWPIALIGTFYILRFSAQLMLPSAALAAILATMVVAWAIAQVINERRFTTASLMATGLLCSLILTMKINDGINAAAAAGLMAVGLGWKHGGVRRALRNGAILTTSWALGVVVWWTIAGQNIAHIPEWIRVSAQLSAGYGDAMGISQPGRGWQIPAAIVTVAIVGAIAYVRLRRHAPVLRLTVLTILGVHWAIMGTWSFVRHDAHATAFFATTLLVLLAFWHRTMLRYTVPASIALGITAWLVVLPPGPDKQWDRAVLPWETSFAENTIKGLTVDRVDLMDTSRTELARSYGLSAEIVAELTGETVHIDPQEAALAWAFPEFKWDPLPIYQEYQAYSAALDDRNADRLADADKGPRYVLRQNVTVDDRIARFESPAVLLELACAFEPINQAGHWVLFERSDNKCGDVGQVGSVETDDDGVADFTALIEQASPDDIVLARWPDVEDRNGGLAASLWKSDPWYADLHHDARPGRIIPALAGQWHMLAVPECMAMPQLAVDTTPIDAMTFLRGAAPDHSPVSGIEVELATMPYACPDGASE